MVERQGSGQLASAKRPGPPAQADLSLDDSGPSSHALSDTRGRHNPSAREGSRVFECYDRRVGVERTKSNSNEQNQDKSSEAGLLRKLGAYDPTSDVYD